MLRRILVICLVFTCCLGGGWTCSYKAAEKKPAAQTNARPSPGEVWREPVTGMEFAWVPGGCYQMGCGSWAGVCDDDEKPLHEVCLDGFWMGKYEVTQGEWQKITGSNPSKFKKGDRYPVEEVSYIDAQTFARELSTKNGRRFRLPTEAEWEYACRSGGRQEIYAGGSSPDSLAWYGDTSADGSTHPVGSKQPNGLGLYDMSGNVEEWCEDVYDDNAYKKHRRNNPLSSGGGPGRVLRGGNWRYVPWFLRCTERNGISPDFAIYHLGFRLVIEK